MAGTINAKEAIRNYSSMLLERLKRPRQMLGIHLERDEIAVLSLKEEETGFTVGSAVRTLRSSGDLGGDLGTVFAKGGGKPFKGKAVIVTDDVKFLAIDLRAAGSEKLSDQKLLAAAIWEMEPYLNFPPSDGLFECRLQTGTQAGDTVPVLISAIPKKTYAEFTAALKGYGIDLVAAYPPQTALACASNLPGPGKSKILLDVGRDTIKAVLLSENGPVLFQDRPAEPSADLSEEMIRDIVYELGVRDGDEVEMLLSGRDLNEDLVRAFGSDFTITRIWGAADLPGREPLGATAEFGPAYAIATGAILGAMGRNGTMIPAVTDRVPLGKRAAKIIKDNQKAIPAVALCGFVLCLALHFGYTQFRISRYQSAIQRLEKEKGRLETPLTENKRLKGEIEKTQKRTAFIRDTLPTQQRHVRILLEALPRIAPLDLVVNKIRQLDTRTFTLEGNAYRGKAITDFSQALGTMEACDGARLMGVQRANNDSMRNKILPYAFTIKVIFH
jgi:Tfp pilus assembly protein PilN